MLAERTEGIRTADLRETVTPVGPRKFPKGSTIAGSDGATCAAAPLIEQEQVVTRGIEEAPLIGIAPAARPAMQENRRTRAWGAAQHTGQLPLVPNRFSCRGVSRAPA